MCIFTIIAQYARLTVYLLRQIKGTQLHFEVNSKGLPSVLEDVIANYLSVLSHETDNCWLAAAGTGIRIMRSRMKTKITKWKKKNEDQLKTNYLVATVTFVSSTKLNRISLRLWWKPQKCPIKMPTDKNTMRLFYCGFMHVMHERAHWYKHILVKYLLVSLA